MRPYLYAMLDAAAVLVVVASFAFFAAFVL